MKAPLFLRAKHWQIFVPSIAIPIVSMIVFVIIMVSTFAFDQPEGPEDMFWIFKIVPIITILCASTQFLWMWNVAVNLRKYIHSADRKPRVNLFRVTFVLPILYIALFPLLMLNVMSGVTVGHQPDPTAFIALFLFGILGNFLMMFCMLNNNYVVAKTIKMAELQRKVTFGDFVGDFFFLLIFPVAIWFLQPRINRIVNGETGEKKVRTMAPTPRENDLLDF